MATKRPKWEFTTEKFAPAEFEAFITRQRELHEAHYNHIATYWGDQELTWPYEIQIGRYTGDDALTPNQGSQ